MFAAPSISRRHVRNHSIKMASEKSIYLCVSFPFFRSWFERNSDFPGVEPSMFGRDLTEQVQADSQDEDRRVPVIVEKCIEAVEARGEIPALICIPNRSSLTF